MRWLAVALFVCGVLVGAPAAMLTRHATAHYSSTYEQAAAFGFSHTDPYGTVFKVRSKVEYNSYPVTASGIVHTYRSYMEMDIRNLPPTYYLDCMVSKMKWNIGSGSYTSGENYWDGTPFPLTYHNTPRWDWTTWEGDLGVANGGRYNGNYPLDIEYYHSASRKSVCQTAGGNSDGVLTNFNALPANGLEIDPDPYTR